MFSMNGYLIIEPLKEGVISNDSGSVYRVVNVGGGGYVGGDVRVDDEIVVDQPDIVRVNVKGEEVCFIKTELILANLSESRFGNVRTISEGCDSSPEIGSESGEGGSCACDSGERCD